MGEFLGLELHCRIGLANCENIGDLWKNMEERKESSDCTLEGWEKDKLVVISEPVRESELPLGGCACNASYINGDCIHNK